MKVLLSKQHYSYKTHTLFMKSSGYPFYWKPPYMDYPRQFYMKILIPPSMIFRKSQPL